MDAVRERTLPDHLVVKLLSDHLWRALREEWMKNALNWCPWVRSLTYSPDAVLHSPAPTIAARPTTVTRSRWPLAFVLRTQKPFSGLW